MTALMIFLDANIKWTGYQQGMINVLSSLSEGDMRAWLLISVMAGLLVLIFKNK